ncbi:MAG: beta-lactamase hydrolase domain-containing protein [Gemmatimonas sp.]
MNRAVVYGTLAIVATFTPLVSLSAQKIGKSGAIASLPTPALLDTTGMFQARYAKLGDDFFIAGQPTEKALREMKAQGVTLIVNLRTPEEMKSSVKFDEPALIQQLGIKYVYIPMRGNAEFPYSPTELAKFTDAVKANDGKVLLHCTVAWRASHLWAAYLIKERGVPIEAALANARAINLSDTNRMGMNGRQPVEDLLNVTLPTLGRPPKQ